MCGGQKKRTGSESRESLNFRFVAGGSSWEEGLDKSLDVWRKELNVKPIRKGQNSWYEVLADLQL